MNSEESVGYILVVDDEPDVRKYLKMALEDEGFTVEEASDGREALDAVRRRPPALISLDLVMPGYSGARFHRELQKNSEWSRIPVLIVTGHARDDLGKADLDELTMSGPGIYLEKPVKPAAYVAAARKLLGLQSEAPTPAGEEQLRDELARKLKTADAEALRKALAVLGGGKGD